MVGRALQGKESVSVSSFVESVRACVRACVCACVNRDRDIYHHRQRGLLTEELAQIRYLNNNKSINY